MYSWFFQGIYVYFEGAKSILENKNDFKNKILENDFT